jgi:hypothetical protein
VPTPEVIPLIPKYQLIDLFPGNYSPPSPEPPTGGAPGGPAGEFAGQTTAVLIHEIMHWKCPVHAPYLTPPHDGAPQPNPEDVCALINYWVETGKALCDEIQSVGQCNDDPSCDNPDFPKDGSTVPSLDDYCRGLCKAYEDLQARVNTPEVVSLWQACVCQDGWTPGALYGDCPFEQPSNCPDAFPDGVIVPDCPCPCNDSIDDPQDF